ncbi:hypothetical protein GCM10009801_75130 [Streptomyces albiaxialis]|uniref:DUF3885 domain-containing protein n=1 Tax=Streptomyces albiaxialis TaxID=329523 RepID=A0ABN2X026_9ACTN
MSPLRGLTELWEDRWGECAPVAHLLRGPYRDVWVRFHSLPGSKRYPEDEREYGIALDRYNTVLDELFAGQDVYVIAPVWTDGPRVPHGGQGGGPGGVPGAVHWRSLPFTDDPDPEFHVHCHLFAARRPWRRGCVDGLLRDVADDRTADVMIADTGLRRVHHPYDGGADVFLASAGERDRMRERHAEWLSSHPAGL